MRLDHENYPFDFYSSLTSENADLKKGLLVVVSNAVAASFEAIRDASTVA